MPAPDFNLSDFLPYRLAVLTARVSKLLASIYEERFGLTMPEWRVMVHVARSEKVSIREIHNCVNLEKPSVSRAVAKLEEAGLLAKATSARDQRLVEIVLTPAGQKVLEALIPEALAVEARLLGALSEGEREQFSELMERLHRELDLNPDAPKRSAKDLPSSESSRLPAE